MEIPTFEMVGAVTDSLAILSRKKIKNFRCVISANTFISKRSNYQQISTEMTHGAALQG